MPTHLTLLCACAIYYRPHPESERAANSSSRIYEELHLSDFQQVQHSLCENSLYIAFLQLWLLQKCLELWTQETAEIQKYALITAVEFMQSITYMILALRQKGDGFKARELRVFAIFVSIDIQMQ